MGFLNSIGGAITGAVGGFMGGGPVGAIVGGGLGLLSGNEQRRADDKSRRAQRRADAEFRANLAEATGYQTGAVNTSTDLQLQALSDAGLWERGGLQQGTAFQLEGLEGGTQARMDAYGRQETLAGEEYERTSGAYRPQLEMGREALSRLNFLSGGGTAEEQATARAGFETSPGYTFRQEQGEKGIRRLANARGQLGSGAMYKDLLKYNQGLATDEYGNYVGQIQNVAGYLPAAARGTATAGSNYGGQLRGIEGGRGTALEGLATGRGQLQASEVMGLSGSLADELRSSANLESNRALDIADLEANRLAGESNIMMNAYERKAAEAQQTAARRQGQIGQLQGMLGFGGGGGGGGGFGMQQLMQMFSMFGGGGGGGGGGGSALPPTMYST